MTKDKLIQWLKKLHLYKIAKTIHGKVIRAVYSIKPYRKAKINNWNIFVDCRDPRGRAIYTRSTYYPGTGELLSKLWQASFVLSPSYFLDVGANYGEVALTTRYPDSTEKIYLIEANSEVSIALQKSINCHPDHKKIELINQAVSDLKNQKVVLSVPEISTGIGSIMNLNNLYPDIRKERFEVTTTTLDALLGELNSEVVVMKIDVEGAEFDVLKGGQNFLAKNKALIFIEIDTIYLKELNISSISFFEFLHSFGSLYFPDQKKREFIPFKNMRYSQIWSTLFKRDLLSDYFKPKDSIIGDFILFSNNFIQKEIEKYFQRVHQSVFL